MLRTQQKDILLCAAPIQVKFRAPVKTAFPAREGPILNPSPCSPGGGRRCSRPGAASGAGSSGLVVEERSTDDGLSTVG